jgi:NADH dehydrogenase [ubiquinone] 1 alpha subcomplex assembly factor 7
MTSKPAYDTHPITPLEERLVALIEDHGPIRIGDYMADALGHPQHGYYMTQNALGAEGDFTTAPEISQIFGELIGAWLINAWEQIGAPSLVNLIELGPGRGTLMSDILRTAEVRPKFRKALRVYMVETSGRLRYAQQRKLADSKVPVTWATEMHDIPAAPTLIIANEFFDCLPIRQFVRTTAREEPCWQERLVGITQVNGENRLCYTFSEELHPTPEGTPAGAQPQDMFEVCEEGRDIIKEIALRFADHKGRALIIDYGHGRSGFGDTLQALRNHRFWPPLAEPGMADVTAHVDFAALARTGRDQGLLVHGPELQGRLLSRLGLKERAQMLAERATEEQREQIISGAKRLVDTDEMGTLFKALCLSSAGLPAPAGFE